MNAELSEGDMKGIVAAMSEFAAGVVPGMSFLYREYSVVGSYRQYDSYNCDVLIKVPGVDPCVVYSSQSPLYDFSFGPPAYSARNKLVSLLQCDGWPPASGGGEMRLKLAASSTDAFRHICERYLDYALVGDFDYMRDICLNRGAI